MPQQTLTQAALIGGILFQAGDQLDCDDAVLEQGYRAADKQRLRGRIEDEAGDTLSQLGTTADAAQVLVLFACADAVALAAAADFAAYKKARLDSLAALSGGADGAAHMVEMAGKLLADVQSGAVVMPFLVKPDKATGVFADVAQRATRVAQVLMPPQAAAE